MKAGQHYAVVAHGVELIGQDLPCLGMYVQIS